MSSAITCNVILTSASTRSDGSLSLKLATPELEPAHKTVFFELLNKNLKMLLQPTDNIPVDLKEVKGQFDRKSPSQRLRSVIYLHWKQSVGAGDFEDHYRKQIEVVIESFKTKLEPMTPF